MQNNLTKVEELCINREIKEKMALCVSDLIKIFDKHNSKEEECIDIMQDLSYVLNSHDLHMEDFTDNLGFYPTFKYKLAKMISICNYDRGLFVDEPLVSEYF